MLVWEKINMALNSISKLIFYAKDLVPPITNRYVCPSHIMMNLSWTFLLSWDFLWCRNRRLAREELWHHTPSHSFQLLSIIEPGDRCYDETLFSKSLFIWVLACVFAKRVFHAPSWICINHHLDWIGLFPFEYPWHQHTDHRKITTQFRPTLTTQSLWLWVTYEGFFFNALFVS